MADAILPGDMRDIMNQVLMAEKKAQANIVMRREETASTRSLLNTAKLMEDDIQLVGRDLDEAPMVYKNIEVVIDAQRELVEVLTKFTPKLSGWPMQTGRRGGRIEGNY